MKFNRLILSQFCLLASRPYHVSAFRGIPLVITEGHRGFIQQALELDSQKTKRHTILPPATTNILHRVCPMNTAHTGPLYMASTEAAASEQNSNSAPGEENVEGTDFLPQEVEMLEKIFQQSIHDSTALTQHLVKQLPTMNAGLILKLKQAQGNANETVRAIATSLNAIMDAQLAEAKDILQSLLSAGEIRKMDSLIGKAARDGKLDAAFFTVLQMNVQNAAQMEQQAAAAAGKDADSASQLQILQHVYTRCQEEVEKNVPAGIALLNKLLRTEVDSIRANQLKHYLCPQPNTITSPDGTVVELGGEPRILVDPNLLVDAIAKAVKQIRTVEQAGGTDRASAAAMVESCRNVAKEARIVIGENYGIESETLRTFEEGLQPVFRPESPESPYIKGE